MIISIIGKSGSGKSTIARTLASYDDRMLHVDVDQISHIILTYPEVQQKLLETFGNKVVENGEVQRKVLGKIVFNSPQEMAKLTEITWSSMEIVADKIIENNPDKIIILDWLLIPKTKYFDQSDIKIWVESPLEDRVERVIERDNITRDYFIKRDNAGIECEPEKYDFIINNVNHQKTNKEVRKIYEKSILRRQF